jgi:hypothetical protein
MGLVTLTHHENGVGTQCLGVKGGEEQTGMEWNLVDAFF